MRDGAYVFAVDNKDEYIFRQLRIIEGKYILTALHEDYEAIEINGMKQIIWCHHPTCGQAPLLPQVVRQMTKRYGIPNCDTVKSPRMAR